MNHEQGNIIKLEKGNLSQLVESTHLMLGSPLQASVQGIISLKLPVAAIVTAQCLSFSLETSDG